MRIVPSGFPLLCPQPTRAAPCRGFCAVFPTSQSDLETLLHNHMGQIVSMDFFTEN